MNEETVLETEIQSDSTTEPTPSPDETAADQIGDWTVASDPEPEETEVLETTIGAFPDDTVPETSELITVEVIESVGSDIVHADLFGSFLICGTLIGLALLRRIHGT